jgi:hypothetical protein
MKPFDHGEAHNDPADRRGDIVDHFTSPLDSIKQGEGRAVNPWVVSAVRVGEFFRETFGVRT